MISATSCKIHSLAALDEFCTKEIQPSLMKSGGNPVYVGKFNAQGTVTYYISKPYAKDRPTLETLGTPRFAPQLIAEYLRAQDYTVEWVPVTEHYKSGYSSSGRTCYYPGGCLKYYSLKITY